MPLKWPLIGLSRTSKRPRQVEVSDQGNLYVSTDLPGLADLVNRGVVWSVIEATLVNSVIALPTTTAQLTLYNDEPAGGKSYIMLRFFALIGAVPAGLSQLGIAYCVNRVKPTTKPTADIAVASIRNLKALAPSYDGKAVVDLAATIIDDGWMPVGYSNLNALSGVGWQLDVWLDGLIIVPPGGTVSTASVASSTTVTTRSGMTWAEVQL